MHEFDTVSVSSFEAASLAAKLTEKSADGWDVVAIVPAGSEVTAYLRREGTSARSDESAEQGAATAVGPAAAMTAASAAREPEPVEPAGWGSAPEASAASSSWGSSGTPAESSSSWGTDRSGATAGAPRSDSASDTTAAWGTGATTPASTAASTADSSSPSVPPGWYADPSGRYELRYWDGAAWTEHVARQGQQYTDPPVA